MTDPTMSTTRRSSSGRGPTVRPSAWQSRGRLLDRGDVGPATAVRRGRLSPPPATAAPQGGTFNWMTWGDHCIETQLKAIEAIRQDHRQHQRARGNAEGYAKLKEVKGQLDKMSADALWVPDAYDKDGAHRAVRHQRAQGLVAALSRSPGRSRSGRSPRATSATRSAGRRSASTTTRPRSRPAPDSWDVLLDPKYKGRIVVENQPEEIVAYMGKAAGFDKPTADRRPARHRQGAAREAQAEHPEVRQPGHRHVNSLVSGEAWLATGNIGNEDRVKDGGGPEIKGFTPKEGTVGWKDAEMIVKGGANKKLIMPFLEKSPSRPRTSPRTSCQRPAALQRDGLQDPRRPGPAGPGGPVPVQQGRDGPDHGPQGPGTSTREVDPAFNEVFGA